jgi:adenosylcobinamide amidohydrolase
MERLVHRDDGAGRERPVLVWRFDEPLRAVSSAVLGGGVGDIAWVFNAEVTIDYRHPEPAEHARDISRELGLAGTGVGLLTAAGVLDVAVATDVGATAAATVGISTPAWAAAPDGASHRWSVGTINLVCHVPAALSDAALVNAAATVTEAKAQALFELGVPGTGTPSDAFVVSCLPGGDEPYGGPRSTWGSRLARATHEAVLLGGRAWLATAGRPSPPQTSAAG